MTMADKAFFRAMQRSLGKEATEELVRRMGTSGAVVASIGGRLHPTSSTPGLLDNADPLDASPMSDNYASQTWLALNGTNWELTETGTYEVILGAICRPGVDPTDTVALTLAMQNNNLAFYIPNTTAIGGQQSGLLKVSAAPYTLALQIGNSPIVVSETPWVTNGFNVQLDVIKLA